MTLLTTYMYTYGAGTEANRWIEFHRDGANAASIKAKVFGKLQGQVKEISTLEGADINVEVMSISDKVKALQEERVGRTATRTPDKKLSEFNLTTQEDILKTLEPNGPWRIEITNGFGQSTSVEKVVRLSLFNPS